LSIAAEKNPEEAMKYYKEYRNSSWAQEFGMKILKSKTPNELSFLFHNAALLTPQDLMSFLKILERNPDSVLFIDGSIIYNSAYLALIKEKISTIEDKDVKQKLNDNLEKQLLKIEQFSQNILNPQTQKATPTKGMSEMKKILWNDPALKFALRIENGWLMPKPANEQTMDKFKLLIARDLYMQKKPLTMFNTQDSYQKLLRQKASMGEMMIFGGRNVVFATNNAFNENNDLSDMIKKEGGELSLYKTDVKDETIMKSVKQKLLTSISDTVPPLTFIFSRSERNSGFKFSSTEFSTALNARHQKYPDEMPPILIFDNDQRFAFIKEVYSRLTYKENLPICISAAEFKQYSGSADLIYDVMGSGKEKFTSLADSVYLNKQRKKKKT